MVGPPRALTVLVVYGRTAPFPFLHGETPSCYGVMALSVNPLGTVRQPVPFHLHNFLIIYNHPCRHHHSLRWTDHSSTTMADITYKTVMNVTIIWDHLKSSRAFQDRAGELIFSRMFELEPKLLSLFHFSDDEGLTANVQFSAHARVIVDMIDMAVSALGPDLDPLAEDLIELGQRHVKYGVPCDCLPVMEKAVMFALEEILQDKITREDRKSWQTIFHFVITHMTKGMKGRGCLL